MNSPVPFHRTQMVDRTQAPLNKNVIQRQAASDFQEKKSLFRRGISSLSRGIWKFTNFLSWLFNRKTCYSGELKVGKEAVYTNSRGEQVYVKILGFRGVSKAIVEQWNGTFKRSVHRLTPIMAAIAD